MKDHKGDIKQYVHVSRAWYGKRALEADGDGIVDRVQFGFYAPDGGTSGEMGMYWISICGQAVPQLKCFNDAWHALYQLQDVLAALAELDDVDITPEQFCELLDQGGFVDVTKEVRE